MECLTSCPFYRHLLWKMTVLWRIKDVVQHTRVRSSCLMNLGTWKPIKIQAQQLLSRDQKALLEQVGLSGRTLYAVPHHQGLDTEQLQAAAVGCSGTVAGSYLWGNWPVSAGMCEFMMDPLAILGALCSHPGKSAGYQCCSAENTEADNCEQLQLQRNLMPVLQFLQVLCPESMKSEFELKNWASLFYYFHSWLGSSSACFSTLVLCFVQA